MDLFEAYQSDVMDEIPSTDQDRFGATQFNETVDLLDNLGYVDFEKNDEDGSPPGAEEVSQGIRLFRTELKQSVLFERLAPEDDRLSEFELDFLANLSDLEGRFSIVQHIEALPSDPLLIRVLKFRLQILGMLSRVDKHFDDSLKEALEKMHGFTGTRKLDKLLTLLDDFDKLIKAVAKREHKGGFRNLLFFHHKTNRRVFKEITNFRNRLWIVPEEDRSFYEASILDKNSLNKSAVKHIESVMQMPVSDLIIRLIQIKLSLIGSYSYRIDGQMKAFSVESLENLYRVIDELNEKRLEIFVEPSQYLYRLPKGYWALNYKYLLQEGIPKTELDYEDGKDDTKAVTGQLQEIIDGVDATKDKKAIINAIRAEIDSPETARQPRRKRKYRKAKSFMRNAISFFKKVGRLISKGVRAIIDAIKKFFQWIKTGITYLIRELKEAFEKLATAFKFLFSKRKVMTGENAEIVSDFDVDFDAVSKVKDNIPPALAVTHGEVLDKLIDAVSSTFGILKVAIPLLIQMAKGPIGWIQTGLKLVSLLLKGKFDSKFQPVLSILT